MYILVWTGLFNESTLEAMVHEETARALVNSTGRSVIDVRTKFPKTHRLCRIKRDSKGTHSEMLWRPPFKEYDGKVGRVGGGLVARVGCYLKSSESRRYLRIAL